MKKKDPALGDRALLCSPRSARLWTGTDRKGPTDESWACFSLYDSQVSTAAGCASHRRANANLVSVASYDAIDVRVLVGAFATTAWSEREQRAYDEPRRRSADLFWTFIRTALCDKSVLASLGPSDRIRGGSGCFCKAHEPAFALIVELVSRMTGYCLVRFGEDWCI